MCGPNPGHESKIRRTIELRSPEKIIRDIRLRSFAAFRARMQHNVTMIFQAMQCNQRQAVIAL